MKLTKNEIKMIEKEGRKILQESSAQIAEEIYEIGINRENSTWKLGLINRGRWEEGDFESRLYDFIEDTEIWLEVEHINEDERTDRTNQGFQLIWNSERGTYMIQESICIWHLDEWCQGDWGSIYLEGGVNQGKYYKVERLVLCEMLNELLCWASARLALQSKMKYEG